jgi:cell division protease FtsH
VLGGASRFAIGGPTRLLDPTVAKYRFSDVAGQEEAKDQMTEIVDFLRDPETFTRLGAKAPKGALMVGPPGVGKTLLARAVAGETHSAFIAVSGADFRQTFMGLGANKVRNMFKLARKNAPCLIFIDEIETLARKRSASGSGGINTEEEATLNALLVEMDGFNDHKGVVVLGATNRPDLIDAAVLRPGRFDRRINLEVPDLAGRVGILRVHARNKTLAPDVDYRGYRLREITCVPLARVEVGRAASDTVGLVLRMIFVRPLTSSLSPAVSIVLEPAEVPRTS